MAASPELKELMELAEICKSVYRGPVKHTILSYKGVYFKGQKIVHGSFGRGYVRIIWNDQHLLLAFRGTRGKVDWVISNLLFIPRSLTKFERNSRKILVHFGFQNTLYFTDKTTGLPSLDAIYHHITDSDLFKGRKVIMTGHSLGGALALMCFVKLSVRFEDYFKNNTTDIVLFGSPAVGLKGFRDYFESLNQSTARIVNESDSVPFLPPFSYYHVGQEIWLENQKIEPGRGWRERLRTASRKPWKKFISDHSMDAYISNLQSISQNSGT